MEVPGIGSSNYINSYESEDKKDSKIDFSKFLEEYSKQVEEKIKNGETKPKFQIGDQSYTEEEWKKLVEKIDKDIDKIQEDQEERLEKQQEEQMEKESMEDKKAGTVHHDVSEIQIRKLLGN